MTFSGVTVYKYGDHPNQWARLTVPPEPWTPIVQGRSEGILPVCVLIHGGYWKQKYTADNTNITGLVPGLAARGFAVWELEYRRRDDEGGGWPGSNDDCLCGFELLKSVSHENRLPLDLTCVTVIGHSAGGTMALWVGAKAKIVVPRLVVSVAGVADLFEAYRAKLSDEGDAIEKYMHCTPDTSEGSDAYARACPTHLLPVTSPTLIVHGAQDTDVPLYMSQQYYSRAMQAREKSEKFVGESPTVELLELQDGDHCTPLTNDAADWETVIARVLDMLK